MNRRSLLLTFLAAVALAVSACGGESTVDVASSDPALATPNPPGDVEIGAILEHLNTHVSDFGEGWQQDAFFFVEGGILGWDTGCPGLDRLGEIFSSSQTSLWTRGDARITHQTEDFNFRAYELAFNIERIPDTCPQVQLDSGTVASISVDEAMFSEAQVRVVEDDPNGVIVSIMLDSYPIAATETAAPAEFDHEVSTWVVLATRHNVVSQLIYAPDNEDGVGDLVELVNTQVANLVEATPEGRGSFSPDPPPRVAEPGTTEDVELRLDSLCRNGGRFDAVGLSWALAELAPFEWEGQESIRGDLVTDGTTFATFTSDGSGGVPALSVQVTSGGVTLGCTPWELPEPVEPSTSVGNLECGDRPIVEDRLDNDGRGPLEVVMEFHPDAVSVEPAQTLFWDAFDANGLIIATLASGDSPEANWQIWSCS